MQEPPTLETSNPDQTPPAETPPADSPDAGVADDIEGVTPRAEDLDTILQQLDEMWRGFLQLVPQLVLAIAVVFLTAALARFVSFVTKKVIGRFKVRQSLIDLIGQIAYIVFWLVGLLVAGVIVFPDLTVGRLVAGLGIGSIALGFAFKDIVENLIAGFLILWRYPIEIGDYIDCDGVAGKVEDINIRATHVRTVEGDLIIVPNSKLFLNPTYNQTNWREKRLTVICGVAYGEDVDASREVIRKAVEACSTVRKGHRKVEVFAQAFGASSIDFEVTWWTGSTPLELRQSRDEIVAAVKRALDDAGIEIPFPYRTLTFKEPLPLVHPSRDESSED
ncbi:MAG: mechanosensitive ion channel [Planctomycetota bacterium]